jgi:uncharacterized protein YybS (DUF2232 family)
MLLKILFYFFLLAVGWFLSNKEYIKERYLVKIGGVQNIFLFFLIFVMGTRLGMDEQVINSIGQIGFKAFAFAFFTSGFSVLFVYVIRKKFIHNKNITGDANDN